MVRQFIIRLRKNGQITLPVNVRKRWKLEPNDELILIIKDDECIIKPLKKVSVDSIAGKFGPADKDEIEFAVMDTSLISEYYLKKYGDSK